MAKLAVSNTVCCPGISVRFWRFIFSQMMWFIILEWSHKRTKCSTTANQFTMYCDTKSSMVHISSRFRSQGGQNAKWTSSELPKDMDIVGCKKILLVWWSYLHYLWRSLAMMKMPFCMGVIVRNMTINHCDQHAPHDMKHDEHRVVCYYNMFEPFREPSQS